MGNIFGNDKVKKSWLDHDKEMKADSNGRPKAKIIKPSSDWTGRLAPVGNTTSLAAKGKLVEFVEAKVRVAGKDRSAYAAAVATAKAAEDTARRWLTQDRNAKQSDADKNKSKGRGKTNEKKGDVKKNGRGTKDTEEDAVKDAIAAVAATAGATPETDWTLARDHMARWRSKVIPQAATIGDLAQSSKAMLDMLIAAPESLPIEPLMDMSRHLMIQWEKEMMSSPTRRKSYEALNAREATEATAMGVAMEVRCLELGFRLKEAATQCTELGLSIVCGCEKIDGSIEDGGSGGCEVNEETAMHGKGFFEPPPPLTSDSDNSGSDSDGDQDGKENNGNGNDPKTVEATANNTTKGGVGEAARHDTSGGVGSKAGGVTGGVNGVGGPTTGGQGVGITRQRTDATAATAAGRRALPTSTPKSVAPPAAGMGTGKIHKKIDIKDDDKPALPPPSAAAPTAATPSAATATAAAAAAATASIRKAGIKGKEMNAIAKGKARAPGRAEADADDGARAGAHGAGPRAVAGDAIMEAATPGAANAAPIMSAHGPPGAGLGRGAESRGRGQVAFDAMGDNEGGRIRRGALDYADIEKWIYNVVCRKVVPRVTHFNRIFNQRFDPGLFSAYGGLLPRLELACSL